MIAKKLRAVATALVLGTAAMAVASIPADAAVRAAVGKPLQEAQALAGQGNYQAAMAKVRQAESVGGLSAEEAKVVKQMKDYLAAKSGGAVGTDTPIGAQAKFDNDYRSGRYRDVINDEDLLRRTGVLNANSMVIIGQAYYQMGDYRGCVRYADSHASAGTAMLERGLLCAFKAGDDTLSRDMASKLVEASPTPEHWNQLLGQAERAKQLTDPQTLDIYRLKYLTGTMKGADDYFTLTQLLLAAHLPSEANAVVERGVQAKLLVDQRAQRLVGMVKQNMANDVGNIGRALDAARKAPKGDELVKVGEDLTGMGKFQDAISTIQAGIAKGVLDSDNAETRLAVAYYGAKEKPQALAALDKVNKTPNGKMIAHIWAIYMRQH
jgi:tetratricopeptide (TPR) repeat protein